MLKIKIKASDITNLTDARYFAAKEVEWLCFNFNEQEESYIDPMKARAMFEWVQGPQILGVFGSHITSEEINFYTEGWGLQAVQVDSEASINTIKSIRNVPIIKDIAIQDLKDGSNIRQHLELFKPYVEAFQFSFDKSHISWEQLKGTSEAFNLQVLKDLAQKFNIILSIDMDINILDEILDINFYGLNIKGGEEERVGVKSFDELDEILDALEVL